MKISVVIPTIREKSIKKFFKEWNFPKDWEIVVVEDNPKKTFSLPKRVKHYCWKDIDKDLGVDSWIISHRNAGIRCYGFLKVSGDIIISLDDDCYPITHQSMQMHVDNLNSSKKENCWQYSCSYKTRGVPYYQYKKNVNIVISHGLWKQNPDLDAIQTMSYGTEPEGKFEGEKIISSGKYYPMCSMNFAFIKKIIPLMYFPLMGQNEPFDRFDDIWAGILSKKVLDHLGLRVWSGQPYVRHIRASNAIKNLVKEASGIEMNEMLWKVVDRVQLEHTTFEECYCDLSDKLDFSDIIMTDKQRKYFNKLKKAMKVWVSLCQKYQ